MAATSAAAAAAAGGEFAKDERIPQEPEARRVIANLLALHSRAGVACNIAGLRDAAAAAGFVGDVGAWEAWAAALHLANAMTATTTAMPSSNATTTTD